MIGQTKFCHLCRDYRSHGWLLRPACAVGSAVRPSGGMFDERLVLVSYLRILGMLWCLSWAPWMYQLIGLLEKHHGALICGDTSYTSLQRRRTAPAAATVQAPEELNYDKGSVPRQMCVLEGCGQNHALHKCQKFSSMSAIECKKFGSTAGPSRRRNWGRVYDCDCEDLHRLWELLVRITILDGVSLESLNSCGIGKFMCL